VGASAHRQDISGLDRLVEILLARAVLAPADVERAKQVGAQTSTRLPAALTRLGLVPEQLLAEGLSAACDLTLAPEGFVLMDPLPKGLNARFLSLHGLVPFAEQDGCISVAVRDPTDDAALAGLQFAVSAPLRIFVAPETAISRALKDITADDLDMQALGQAAASATLRDDRLRLEDSSSDAPVIRLVNRLIAQAVQARASDIHIEQDGRALLVRFRVDGDLQEIERLPDTAAAAVVSRVKVMAGLDIAEKRLPQDGRIRLSVEGSDLDIRVATLPTINGEGVVLRLLGRTDVTLELGKLGLSDQCFARLDTALQRPHGIILMTGPTGSGKTTTLYAALKRLQKPHVKLLSVEDPVEYMLPGVTQVQVRPDIGLTYANTLRAFLRHDPNILMVGEIRDGETADIAIQAALVGRLVLTTLHTNTSLGAITRLVDLGMEPYLLASTIKLTAAQRLVRRLCPNCKIPHSPTAAETHWLGWAGGGAMVPQQIYAAAGCAHCQGSGYRGRLPLAEAVPVSETLSDMIRDRASEAALMAQARSEELFSMAAHGVEAIASEHTTIEEVARVIETGPAACAIAA
jgi:general secretion pathway protein E